MSKSKFLVNIDSGHDILISTEKHAIREKGSDDYSSILVRASLIASNCEGSSIESFSNLAFVLLSKIDRVRIIEKIKERAQSDAELDSMIKSYASQYKERHVCILDDVNTDLASILDKIVEFYKEKLRLNLIALANAPGDLKEIIFDWLEKKMEDRLYQDIKNAK